MRAIEAKPVEAHDLRGASGVRHPLLAVGTDEERRRLVVVSMEHDARSAALAQADLQMAFPGVQVIVARPVLVGVSSILIPEAINGAEKDVIKERLSEHLEKTKERGRAILPKDSAAHDWMSMHFANLTRLVLLATLEEELDEEFKLDLKTAAEEDPIAQDRELGVCGVPIYGFSAEEFNELREADEVDSVRKVLRQNNILQYFFPPPGQLMLGLVGRGCARNRSHLLKAIKLAPEIGHPFGQPEIVEGRSLEEVVDNLMDRGLAVEGEVTMQMGPEGQSLRKTVRFKPREGFLSKLINRFSVNLNLKDLFRIGGGDS